MDAYLATKRRLKKLSEFEPLHAREFRREHAIIQTTDPKVLCDHYSYETEGLNAHQKRRALAYEATNAQDHSASRPARRGGDSPDSSSELELAPSRPRKSSVVSPETSAGLLEPRARPPIADDARGDHHARLRADQCAPRDRRISASEAFRVLCMTFRSRDLRSEATVQAKVFRRLRLGAFRLVF